MAQALQAASVPSPPNFPQPTRRSPLTTIAAWSPALLLAGFLLQAVRTGLPGASAGRALLAVLITQLLPGTLVWRCVRPRRGWWPEDLAMGFALGSGIAMLAQPVAGATRIAAFAAGPGLVVAVALLAIPATRRRIAEAETQPLPIWWAPSVGLTSLLAVQQLQSYYRTVPLTWPAGFRAPHVDTYFHLSMAAELAHRGPGVFPWVNSEPLAYHWFSHAWVAQVSTVSGTGLDQVLVRFTPALMPLVMTFAVATAAIRLSGRLWTGPLAAGLALAGGDLNVFGKLSSGYSLAPLSPSLGLSAPSLIALVVVIALLWRRELRRGGLLLIPLLTLIATGAKGSTTPLVVAGLGLAAVAMAGLNRPALGRVLLVLGLVLPAMALTVATVFRGSSAGLHVEPKAAVLQSVTAAWFGVVATERWPGVVAVFTVVGVLSRGLGLLALLAAPSGRRNPLTWLFIGIGLAAAGAVVTFAHPGASQWYFVRSADPLLALGSALGLAALRDRLDARIWPAVLVGIVAGPTLALAPPELLGELTHRGGVAQGLSLAAVALAVLAVAAGGAMLWAALARGPIRATAGGAAVISVLSAGVAIVVLGQLTAKLPPPAPSVTAGFRLAVSRDQVDAARWIRDHSDVDDLVMTNRHCVRPTEPRHCDSRRFVVAAFSERRVLVEGWTGSARATAIAPKGNESIVVDYWRPDLLRLNDDFITRPTAAAARKLYALGVRWVFVDHTRPYAPTLAPHAVPRLRNPGVEVYELRSSRG